jgi:catechol 2,3-dioxygenase-like lactoylglutathione lyase family enzyme
LRFWRSHQKLGGQQSVFSAKAQWGSFSKWSISVGPQLGTLRPSHDGTDFQEETMKQSIATVALVVRDYDEAIAYYCGVLGFALAADQDMGGGRRWVVVTPEGSGGAGLLLARAADDAQQARIGDQTGGRVFLFLQTDGFERDFQAFSARGVRFLEEPRQEAYGTVAVFEDVYGNKWDLIEPNGAPGV